MKTAGLVNNLSLILFIIYHKVNRISYYCRKLYKVFDNWEFQEYLKDVLSILEGVQTEQEIERIEKIICFGIGSCASSITSLHQLAFLMRIQQHFNVKRVDFYDPVLSESEKRILEQYDWHSMPENCEGKYHLGESTIIYLPHCPKQLTNNFLWENWQLEKLSKAILICNSFSALVNNTPTRFLNAEAEYVLKISNYVQEVSLDGKYFLADVFNDTSIHTLSKEKCSEIKEEFWTRGDAPQYTSSELIMKESFVKATKNKEDEFS